MKFATACCPGGMPGGGKERKEMPLSMARAGERNVIKRVGGKEETRLFLERLGFVVGSSVTVISEAAGNLIVNIRESRVAIGKDMAGKIMVCCEHSEP